ncbi:Catalase-peroxidase 1 [Dissostichus eleginoides]|uniref:Catalase-peroxidase 1 n=1 Tax=Dissostichus eleginoides TaxID=100907 RepID=A0AAD9BL19_DISEL|nr:Catalase-peroxidase 1 [Dissostichus eleginoides]
MAWWQPARQPIKTPVAGHAANETSALCGSQAVRCTQKGCDTGRQSGMRGGGGGGKVKMERSLAPDQDRRHIVPSSSRTKRCHAELCGISLPKNTGPKR